MPARQPVQLSSLIQTDATSRSPRLRSFARPRFRIDFFVRLQLLHIRLEERQHFLQGSVTRGVAQIEQKWPKKGNGIIDFRYCIEGLVDVGALDAQ